MKYGWKLSWCHILGKRLGSASCAEGKVRRPATASKHLRAGGGGGDFRMLNTRYSQGQKVTTRQILSPH